MKIPLIDLNITFSEAEKDIRSNFDKIFNTHRYVLGPFQKDLEDVISKKLGVKHAVSVSSGTDALLVILMALGIGRDDEVITTDFTFFATAGTVARLGACPVFCDIDPDTQNLDPGLIPGLITPRTKAIIPVHIFGQSADMDAIMKIAEEHGLYVIEDACQSIYSMYGERYTGSIGHAGAFSFFPSKNLGGLGDSGMVTTNDKELCQKILYLRNHGQTSGYFHTMIGGNFRMDEFQAAGLLAKEKHLDRNNTLRKKNASLYRGFFEAEGLLEKGLVQVPFERYDHIYHQYVIQARDRDSLKDYLSENGIGCAVYYPVPLHKQPCFNYLPSARREYPVTEKACLGALGLPVYPGLEQRAIEYIVGKIREFYSK